MLKRDDVLIETITNFIMTVLDPVGIVLGLIIALPVFATWYEVSVGRKKKERKLHLLNACSTGKEPVLLIVDMMLNNKSIKQPVMSFISNNEALKDIPEERIRYYKYAIALTPEKMPEVSKQLNEQIAAIMNICADKIHLFYGGPAVGAAMIGAMVANNSGIQFYQHSSEGYVNFGSIKPRLF